jgi:glycosyltransferase involved in cell wall biosynthesis
MVLDVVIINDTAYVDGGAAAVAVQSAAGLARAGFRVTFVAALGPIAPELQESDVKVVLAQTREVSGGPSSRLMLRRIWNSSASKVTACVLDDLDRRKCVVHAHNWHSAISVSAISVALDLGFELVCTLNDYNIACPAVSFFDRSAMRICALRPLSLKCLARACTRHPASKALAVLRHVVQLQAGIPQKLRHFVTVSDLSESVLRPYFVKEASVYRIFNPVRVPYSQPVAVACNRIYSMVARLETLKGVLLFAEAARLGGLHCRFVGDGPCRDGILRQNSEAEVTGWLSAAEVWEQLKCSRCLVFPSLWYEAQPLAVLQASAIGVPSIVSDACAAREQIEDGVTGLLFRNGDVESLLTSLRRLEDDNFVATLGLNAFNRFWANPPTIERHVAALAAVYDRVLGSTVP